MVLACGGGGWWWRAQCERGVVGSGRGRGRGGRKRRPGRAVLPVRPPLLQRVQPAAARAPDPRGPAGGVLHLRPLLQDAAVPPATHAGAAPRAPRATQAAAAAAARVAARAPLAHALSSSPFLTPLYLSLSLSLSHIEGYSHRIPHVHYYFPLPHLAH